jgi:hypothetical protein
VARDATARQSDVDAAKVLLVVEDGKGSYRPGTITFAARKGKSIDLDQLRAELQKTRLGKGTRSEVTYLEITATGKVEEADKKLRLEVGGTTQQFELGEDPRVLPREGEKTALGRLREAVAKGEKVSSVTGRVQGWSGKWPAVLKELAAEQEKEPGKRKPSLLFVTDFEVARE